jgi:hypothetical protein
MTITAFGVVPAPVPEDPSTPSPDDVSHRDRREMGELLWRSPDPPA